MSAKDQPAPKRKRGRPSKRTPEVEQRIIDGLIQGIPLTVICKPKEMPCPSVVNDWMNADPEFSQAIARARDTGWDAIAQEALHIADTPIEGIESVTGPDGERVTRKDMLGHRKLQVYTRLQLLAKWNPKRYGDRLSQEISGPDGSPIQTQTLSQEQDKALEDLIARVQSNVKK